MNLTKTIMEKTLSIVKPDIVMKNLIGRVCAMLEYGGLKIVAMKMIHLTKKEAEGFYKEHEKKPFYNDLVEYMTSAPVVVQVLEGENAVMKNRKLMGATNPSEAEVGTIRKEFGESVERNSVHGSDSIESALREIEYFFGS